MTVEETNLLHKKATTKKDGVYSFKGNLWAVSNGKFMAFINPKGEVLLRLGSFNTKIGDLSSIGRWEWRRKLNEWVKNKNY